MNHDHMAEYEHQMLSNQLVENIRFIRQEVGNSFDLIVREMNAPLAVGRSIAIIYFDGMVQEDFISNYIIRGVLEEFGRSVQEQSDAAQTLLNVMQNQILSIGGLHHTNNWKETLLALLSGETLIVIDGSNTIIVACTRGGNRRAVWEPTSQTVIRGPREGFTETIRTNTSLVRHKIRSPKLRVHQHIIGTITQTDIAVMYIDGLAKPEIVSEVNRRLESIVIDSVLESGYIEEFIQDETWSPFPTIYNSERPDVIAAGLLEGRVAIMVDGTPFVLLVPVTIGSFFHAPEDYYQRFDVGTLLRILRFCSFSISLILPSLYVAIVSYHQEMIPTSLLLKLAAQREGVPFPAFLEAFLMEITFEILREAGVRMPSVVGNTISIVGALVLGQAAVEAGIVSSAMVIVVALTAISSFVSPTYNLAISSRILRFGLLVAGSILGIYGIAICLLIILLHLCSLRSFGIPFMKPFAPTMLKEWKDVFIRAPIWSMTKRPSLITQDATRGIARHTADNDLATYADEVKHEQTDN